MHWGLIAAIGIFAVTFPVVPELPLLDGLVAVLLKLLGVSFACLSRGAVFSKPVVLLITALFEISCRVPIRRYIWVTVLLAFFCTAASAILISVAATSAQTMMYDYLFSGSFAAVVVLQWVHVYNHFYRVKKQSVSELYRQFKTLELKEFTKQFVWPETATPPKKQLRPPTNFKFMF